MKASDKGHAEAIKLLLTAPDIDVNRAVEVSLYQQTPPYQVVEGRVEGHVTHPTLHSNSRNDDLSSPKT